MKTTTLLGAVLGACLLTGCKIQVTVPETGGVMSHDLVFICGPGQTCELDVSHFDMDMQLHAISKPGYRFVRWRGGKRHVCAGETEQVCRVRTDNLDRDHPELQKLIDGDQMFYLEPEFEPETTPPDTDAMFVNSLLFN